MAASRREPTGLPKTPGNPGRPWRGWKTGEGRRQEGGGDRRGRDQCWKDTEKEIDRGQAHIRREREKVRERDFSRTAAKGYCLRISEASAQKGWKSSIISVRSQPSGLLRGSSLGVGPSLGYWLLTGWPRRPAGPVGPCSDMEGRKTGSVR